MHKTKPFFSACDEYAAIQTKLEPDTSFLDYFRIKNGKPKFNQFMPIILNEYHVLRDTIWSSQWIPAYYYDAAGAGFPLRSAEVKQILDHITLKSFIEQESRNPLSVAFGKNELAKIPKEIAKQAPHYLAYIMQPDQNKGSYLKKLVTVLRGNGGISSHYSHKKYTLRLSDYLPITPSSTN